MTSVPPPPQIEAAARKLGIESARVLVAVSGGCDSVALLRGLVDVQATLKLTLIVAHLNHGWRGEESQLDAEWVRTLGESLGIPCVIETTGQNDRSTSEESARQSRYEFLARTASTQDCRFVATGHTADDQAETVLHHILRGTGLSGLRGIPPTRTLGECVTLVRPLLEIPRTQLEDWLRAIGQDWRTDCTNSDSTFTRNRIRHELLPLLAGQFNPQINRVLTTLACQAGEASDLVRQLAENALPRIVLSSSANSIRLDTSRLSELPAVVQREALVLAWQRQNWPLQKMSYSHWEKLADIASSGGMATLPGNVDARSRGALLVLTRDREA